MKLARLQKIVRAFSNKKILVIGDLILDEFVWGKVSRISPEAPVPIVEVDRETYYAGGAANVARNLREFTGDVRMVSLIGTDLRAQQLKQLLVGYGINLEAVIEDADHLTSIKTRIIAMHQQVVRVDREKISGLNPAHAAELIRRIEKMLPELDALIFEDYGKGLLTQDFVHRIITLARKKNKIVTVDPTPANLLRWRFATVVTPNRKEAFVAAGVPWSEPIDPPQSDAALIEVGKTLLKKWNARSVLITLSEHGMMLFEHGAKPFHIPTRAREVFDVSGAGDTAIALYTLALCGGATSVEAAEISNHASGIVVKKLGTATVTPDELERSFHGAIGSK